MKKNYNNIFWISGIALSLYFLLKSINKKKDNKIDSKQSTANDRMTAKSSTSTSLGGYGSSLVPSSSGIETISDTMVSPSTVQTIKEDGTVVLDSSKPVTLISNETIQQTGQTNQTEQMQTSIQNIQDTSMQMETLQSSEKVTDLLIGGIYYKYPTANEAYNKYLMDLYKIAQTGKSGYVMSLDEFLKQQEVLNSSVSSSLSDAVVKKFYRNFELDALNFD